MFLKSFVETFVYTAYVAEMERTTELGTMHAAFSCINTSVQWSAEGPNLRDCNATNMVDHYYFFYPASNRNLMHYLMRLSQDFSRFCHEFC